MDKFMPGSAVVFHDDDSKLQPDETGCNQIGILMDNSKILFCRNRKLIKADTNKISASKMLLYPFKDEEISLGIFKYFQERVKDYRLFNYGLTQIKSNHFEFLYSQDILPILRKWISSADYENAWINLVSKMQKGDLICVFNEKSIISKCISVIDKGPWSHCAMYIGNGEISEAITTGVVRRIIDVYKNKYIHIGLYRTFDITPEIQNSVVNKYLSLIGYKYNYKGVLLLGFKKLFGLEFKIGSPNDLVCNGSLYLVDFI